MVASLFAKPRQKRMRIYDFRIRRYLFAKKKTKKTFLSQMVRVGVGGRGKICSIEI